MLGLGRVHLVKTWECRFLEQRGGDRRLRPSAARYVVEGKGLTGEGLLFARTRDTQLFESAVDLPLP